MIIFSLTFMIYMVQAPALIVEASAEALALADALLRLESYP